MCLSQVKLLHCGCRFDRIMLIYWLSLIYVKQSSDPLSADDMFIFLTQALI